MANIRTRSLNQQKGVRHIFSEENEPDPSSREQGFGKKLLAEGLAEGAGGAPEAERVEGGHRHDHDAKLRQCGRPADQNQLWIP
jgi:hypothetical protein